jgi:hypothetical protein
MASDSIPKIPTAEPVVSEENIGPLVLPEVIDLVRVGALGLAVGALIPLIAWLLQKFLVAPVFCHPGAVLAVCGGDDLTTYYVATVVMAVIAVTLMANWQVFRPLLIAVAAASALWGLQHIAGGTLAQAGWEYYLSSAVLYALVYLLFYWLLRLRSFTLGVVLTVAAVVLIRWALLA